jgi:glycosidase
MKTKLLIPFLLLSTILINAQIPNWAKGIVWYQIFPERFCNGDTGNEPNADKVFINAGIAPANWKVTPWGSNWFERSEWELGMQGGWKSNLQYRRYGGDLQGVINKLDYIKSLGVGAIYLNPIFDAVSSHKYDGSTYHHIDVNFGPDPSGDRKLIASENPADPKTWKWTSADKLFLRLLEIAHKKGIRVVIDGVFNHTGVQFWAFQDIIKNGSRSAYADWYRINQFDDPATPQNEFDYKGWWNVRSLPEFNRTKDDLQSDVKNYIFAATRRWMDPDNDGNSFDGIDGWRLDVAREVPLGFWSDWRKVVKGINPNAIIIGELWELSPDFIGTNGVFDALMNYSFATAMCNFFIHKSAMTAEDFIAALRQIDDAYPEVNLQLLQNLLDSHDTERLISMIANPGRNYNQDADERNPNYNMHKPTAAQYDRLKLMAAFQFIYRGAPMIYYGDEAGMWGATDPYDRKPMVWDELIYDNEMMIDTSAAGIKIDRVSFDKNLYNFYKRLGILRSFSEALRTGSVEYITIPNNDRVIGILRTLGKEKVLSFFNISSNAEIIEYPTTCKEISDLLVGDKVKLEDSKLRFILWSNSYQIYQMIEP